MVGKPVDRVEGPLKVAGRRHYAYEAPGDAWLTAMLVPAAIAQGPDRKVDAEAARTRPACWPCRPTTR